MTSTAPGLTGSIDDPAILALREMLDPAGLREHLCRSLPLPASEAKALQVQLLRHHVGKRCVFEVQLRTQQGTLCLIGKIYAKDRSDVYRLMEDIRNAGFGTSEEFSIPQPFVYLQPLQLLLQEKVQGRPATEGFLADSQSERELTAERCARWLAKFHAIAPCGGSTFQLGPYLASIEQWSQRFASLGEVLADKARTLCKRLETTGSSLDGTEVRTIHGDFTHHQVIFTQSSTVTVDWDNYALADPARDLARFMVGLKRLALRSLGSIRALDEPAEVFLSTYTANSVSTLASRLAFHKAAICMEHAKHDVHKQASRWRERAAITLDEGLRILEDGA